MRGAGWISVFALALRQKTPLFFSAGDNKWRGEERGGERKSETDQKEVEKKRKVTRSRVRKK